MTDAVPRTDAVPMTDAAARRATRLAPEGYLAALDEDSRLLRSAVIAAPTAPVPGCPGWTATDLLDHVAQVYRHKAAALRLGREPTDAEGAAAPAAPDDSLAAFDAALADVRAELAGRASDAPAWTWWPPEQTVGFWQRRMAQETLVHRVDAEQAALAVAAAGPPHPLQPSLAIDGIDELLGWLSWPWDDLPLDDAVGQRVRVGETTTGRQWDLVFTRTAVEVRGPGGAASDAAAQADAVLAGPADALLLSLWGRPGLPGSAGLLTDEGDPVALDLLRRRLALATE